MGGKRCWGGHEAGREAGPRPNTGRLKGVWLLLAGSQRGRTAAPRQMAAAQGAVGVATDRVQ
jgi:hypothetical protein